MISKYYTPKLEDFHIGFECQYEVVKNYGFKPFTVVNSADIPLSKEGLKKYRVKHLDQKDIESLGFKLDLEKKSPFYESVFTKIVEDGFNTGVMYQIHFTKNRENIFLKVDTYGSWATSKEEMSFRVRSKLELKKILKLVGYEY